MDIWNKARTSQVSQIYGTMIFLGLTVYFLLMYAIGAVHIIGLRFLNVIIMLAGVYYAVRQYRRTHNGEISYFRTLTLGTATAFIGSTTFGIFLFFFLKLEGNLMESIRQNEEIGQYLNPYIATCVVMMEGVISGFGISYLLGNYMKTKEAAVSHRKIPMADRSERYATTSYVK